MPRSGPGEVIGVPYISTVPEVAVSNPAMMRSNVDFPQPDAPIRQTNSPLLIVRLTSRNASTVCSPIVKRLERPLMASVGRALRWKAASCTMLRTPREQAIVDCHDHAVRQKAGEPDHHHAGDHEIGARQRAAIHDHRAQAFRHACHFPDHDEYPRETVPQSQTIEDRRSCRREYDLAEQGR